MSLSSLRRLSLSAKKLSQAVPPSLPSLLSETLQQPISTSREATPKHSFKSTSLQRSSFFRSILPTKQSIFKYGPRLPVLERLFDYISAHYSDYVSSKESPSPLDSETFFDPETVFVFGEHTLKTSVSLIETIIALGAKPQNIFLIGKSYSYNTETVQLLEKLGINVTHPLEQPTLGSFADTYKQNITRMLDKVHDHIQTLKKTSKKPVIDVIVADDGGYIINEMPSNIIRACRIVAVEQTQSGVAFTKKVPFPVILMATSYGKQTVEPTLVSKVISKKVTEIMENIESKFPKLAAALTKKETILGLIGVGTIGQAVMKQLITSGYKNFIIMDLDKPKAQQVAEEMRDMAENLNIRVSNPIAVFAGADIIFGNTGTDITQDANNDIVDTLEARTTPLLLISTSSGDIQYRSLLNTIQEHDREQKFDALSNIEFQNGFKSPIYLYQGGMPANFDKSSHSVPEEQIQYTRALRLVGIAQAQKKLREPEEKVSTPSKRRLTNFKLSPYGQAFAAHAFYEALGEEQFTALGLGASIEELADIDTITTYSEGEPDKSPDMFAAAYQQRSPAPSPTRK